MAPPPTSQSPEAVDSSSDTVSSQTGDAQGVGENAQTASGRDGPLPPLSASWRLKPLSQAENDKVHRILRACDEHNLDDLRHLATSEGGLIEDEVRRATYESDKRKDIRKHELLTLISGVLRQHPLLHYFQGFHDIAQVLLLVLGQQCSIPAVSHLSLLRIRDFMLPTMAGTEPHLHLFKHILYAVDPVLAQHLLEVQPFFALAATLTLYAHEIEEYGDIARLFDFLLANEAVMPLYLYAAIVISRRKELLDFEADEPEILHAILSKLPKPLDLDRLIRRASELFTQHPPEKLPDRAWRSISINSVLKTTHGDPQQLARQGLADGERMFERQAAELRRADVRRRRLVQARQVFRRYRAPAAYAAATVLVAAVALLLGKRGFEGPLVALSPLIAGLRVKAVDGVRFVLGPRPH